MAIGRELTEAEKRDNLEFKRLAKKIAARDAKRGAKEAGIQLKKLYLFTMRKAGKEYGILKRRLKNRNRKK